MASIHGIALLEQSDNKEMVEKLTKQITKKKKEFKQLKQEKERWEMGIHFYKMQLYKLTEIQREQIFRAEYNAKFYKQIKDIYNFVHKIGFLLDNVEWEKIHKYDEQPMLEHKKRIEELDCQAKQQVEQMENRCCVIQLRAAQEKYFKILEMQNQFKKNQAQHKISLAMKVESAEQKRNSHIVALIAITKRVNELQLKLQEKCNSTETCNKQTQMQLLSSDPVVLVSEQVPQINLPNQPIPIKKHTTEEFSLSKPLSNAKNQSSFIEKQPFEDVFKTPLSKPISKAENTDLQTELKRIFQEIDCENYQPNVTSETLNIEHKTSTNLTSILRNPNANKNMMPKHVTIVSPVLSLSSFESNFSFNPKNKFEFNDSNMEEMSEGDSTALQAVTDETVKRASPNSLNQVENALNMQLTGIVENQKHTEEEDEKVSNDGEAQVIDEARDNKVHNTEKDVTENDNPTKSNEVSIINSNEFGILVEFSSDASDLNFTCGSPKKSSHKKSYELMGNDFFDDDAGGVSNDDEFFQYNSADCEIKFKRDFVGDSL